MHENEEDTQVLKKGHTEEQILRALRQGEGGTRVAEICREHGISEATFYIWKKKYSGLGLSELREQSRLLSRWTFASCRMRRTLPTSIDGFYLMVGSPSISLLGKHHHV